MSKEGHNYTQPDLFTDSAAVVSTEQPLAAPVERVYTSIAERNGYDPNARSLDRLRESGAGGGLAAAVSGELLTVTHPTVQVLTPERVVSRAAKVARGVVELPRPGYDNSPDISGSITNKEARTLREQSQPHIAEARAMLGLQSGGLGPRVGR